MEAWTPVRSVSHCLPRYLEGMVCCIGSKSLMLREGEDTAHPVVLQDVNVVKDVDVVFNYLGS